MMKTECWLPIVGFEDLYEVSDLGRVRSLDRIVKRSNGSPQTVTGKIRKTPLVKGYPALYLHRNGVKTFFYVHHLVALTFIGPRPPGQEVAHGDGKSENSALSNLRYATPVENDADKIAHGTRPSGEKNGRSRLTEEEVLEIRRRVSNGEMQLSVRDDFGISSGHMSLIINRKVWRHL